MAVLPDSLDGQILLPDLLRQAPHLRPILDRHGLHGCGGPEGPVESLAFFARAHEVPLETLLGEIRQALASPTPPSLPAEPTLSLADTIYRPFFKAGIAVVLSLGAVWGAFLLLRIGFGGTFSAAGLHEINAHGHAQIFGWVGLFVMGFAYQAFPRFKHTTLAHPRLAYLSLWLMTTGLVLRALLEPLATARPWLIGLALVASTLEIGAISLFAWIIGATWRASGKPLAPHDYYILSALGWFVVQAIYDALYLAATLTTTEHGPLVDLVATWQGPLREIQIHGFALLMILGVSQRIFHHFYGLPLPSPTLSRVGVVVLNVALVGEVTGSLLMRSHGHAWAGLWYASILVLAGMVLTLVWNWRLFARAENPDRTLKFLRAAYLWLLVSLAMLVLLPVYQFLVLPAWASESASAHMGFSHAYYGAIRHAITVGFVSLMIVGVASRVVPTLNGIDGHTLSSLWLPFSLLNLGCALRVSGQVLTDFTPFAFPLAGVSGTLEVLGLLLWGVPLWRLMSRGSAHALAQVHSLQPGEPIRGDHRVGAVLECYPQLLSTFLAAGFTPLQNPLLRRYLAGRVSIHEACRTMAVEEVAFLESLNRAIGTTHPGRLSLPVLQSP